MDTAQVAEAIMTANDEDLAEIFAYAAKLRDLGINGPDCVVPKNVSLEKSDFANLSPFMDWIKQCVEEISTDIGNNSSAWWKQ